MGPRACQLDGSYGEDMGNGSYVADNQLKPPAGLGREPP